MSKAVRDDVREQALGGVDMRQAMLPLPRTAALQNLRQLRAAREADQGAGDALMTAPWDTLTAEQRMAATAEYRATTPATYWQIKRERDIARAEVERLKAELEARRNAR
jgi:hypothetical protein